MLYFDPSRPNKYSSLKRELIPYKIFDKNGFKYTKERYGQKDGSYVLAEELVKIDSAVVSYGIGEDPEGVSFELEMAKMGHSVLCYDPNLSSLNSLWGSGCSFKGEALNKDNFKNHVSGLEDGCKHILKMDIEGHEYDWLTEENLNILKETFNQLTIEVHSLIEEVPEGWIVEPQMLDAKKNREKVLNFFRALNEEFVLFHIHGNNHAPRYVDLPDSLELTYINKKFIYSAEIDDQIYPIEGLDSPNFEEREDYVIDWHL